MKKTSLYFKNDTSDKEYHLQIEPSGTGFVVNFQYGRRLGTLKTGSKTKSPVSLEAAEKIFDSIFREKTSEGYSVGESVAGYSGAIVQSKEVHILPQLLNEIDNPQKYIDDDDYLAQEKKDGERRIAIADGKKFMGLNKKGTEVQLPNSVIASIYDKCEIDGEIIGDKLFVFDLLSLASKSLKQHDYIERAEILGMVKFGDSIEVVKIAYTREEKQQMFDDLKANNKEGIVFKRKGNSPYKHGRPASGGDQLKFKFHKTATFIVQNHTSDKRSVGLELISGVSRVNVGKVTIPPNHDMPTVGEFVEVRYLYAYKGGAIFQPVYLGKRNDCDLSDAGIGQLVYKADN